jgi:hypothetical protein
MNESPQNARFYEEGKEAEIGETISSKTGPGPGFT